jgi:hypothetical protein
MSAGSWVVLVGLTEDCVAGTLVGATGVEPVTSSLSWKRSYQLSYAPARAV